MAKPKAVWVARDNFKDAPYELYSKKPTMLLGAWQVTTYWVSKFCPAHFERITGFRLAPGACVKVRFPVELVKP